MARIDPLTGEICLRIAYVGHPWAKFEWCASRIVQAYDDGAQPMPDQVMIGVYMSVLRPPGLTCRGRPVRVELVGVSRDIEIPESAMRIMLRDVSGIVLNVRGVTHWLHHFVHYQDVLNRALAFWQYDTRRIPQIFQIDRRYCDHCGESFVDPHLRTPLLNPWDAPQMWWLSIAGEGAVEAFDACLARALARAERHIGPPMLERPRTVAPDAMARRAFAIVDDADRSDWLPPETRAALLERLHRDAAHLPIAEVPAPRSASG